MSERSGISTRPPRTRTAHWLWRIPAAGSLMFLVTLAATAGEPPAPDRKDKANGSETTSMRDPLRPPGYGRSADESSEPQFDPSAWQLAYTLVSRQRRTAVVNGHNVREGATVGGATVVQIGPGHVKLDYRGRRFTIRNTTPSIRRPSSGGEAPE